MIDNPGIQSVQDAVWLAKLTNGDNIDNLPHEFFFLKVKVDEALRAFKRQQPKLADAYLSLLGIVAITGSDLHQAVTNKLDAMSVADSALSEAAR